MRAQQEKFYFYFTCEQLGLKENERERETCASEGKGIGDKILMWTRATVGHLKDTKNANRVLLKTRRKITKFGHGRF